MSAENLEELKSVFKKDLSKFVLEAKVSKDNLKLFIDVTPHLTPIVDRAEILNPLKEAFPNSEFDTAVIDEICKNCVTGKPMLRRRVSRGSEPVDGVNGKLLLLVKNYSGTGEPGEDDEGKFSFAELNLFDNIKIDQIVARVYPPKDGKDGMDVLGKPLKAKPGVPVKVTLDKSLELLKGSGLKEDENLFDRIVAKAEGLLMNQNGQLSVKEDLDIKGDVDFHCGNIDFIGKVTIAGDVLPGFRVVAQKGISVRGNMQKATLISKAGDIEIKGYAIGSPDTYVSCGGNFTVTIAQEVHAAAHGNITVTKEAIDCTFRTHQYIAMPTGRIVGGHCYVVHGVDAKEVGNDVGQQTIVEFASEAETNVEFTRLLEKIEAHKKPLRLLEMHLGPFLQMPFKIKYLKGTFRTKMETLFAKMQDVRDSLQSLEQSRDEIMAAAVVNPDCRLNARVTLHPGTTALFRDTQHEFKDSVAGPVSVVFSPEKKEFITEALKDIKCPENQPNVKDKKL